MTALIRLADGGDGPAVASIYRPAVVNSVISFELEPPDGAEMTRRIEATLARTPWLVGETDGAVTGYAYAGWHRERAAYRWSVDVSAYVRQDARRTGVARALYTSLFAVLALQGFRNAYAGITLPNVASVGFHMALGFTPVGIYRSVGFKLGAWHDTGWFERALAPHVVPPPEPIPLPRLLSTAELASAILAGTPLMGRPGG